MKIPNYFITIVLVFAFCFSSAPAVWAHHHHNKFMPPVQSGFIGSRGILTNQNWSSGYTPPIQTPPSTTETDFHPYFNHTFYDHAPNPEVIDINTTPANDTLLSVKVPNQFGDYTTVYLRKVAGGFRGQHGEVYSEFPSVSELKPLYGNQ